MITQELIDEWERKAEDLQATLPDKNYDGTHGCLADVNNLTKFHIGMSCDRLSWITREELLRAIECGGIARWDGEYSAWPSDRCLVWVRFELRSTGHKQVTLINRSTNDREYFTSTSQAIRFIRDYY